MKMSVVNKIISLALLVLLAACASIGNPDGGPYDEDPPVLLKSLPGIGATNVKEGRVVLDFNENIKLVNAFEKVIVSPPQAEMPEIKYSISPLPQRFCAPELSKITRESISVGTENAIRVTKLVLITPVITLVDGRCVATTT